MSNGMINTKFQESVIVWGKLRVNVMEGTLGVGISYW